MDLILSNFGKTASNSADFLRQPVPKFDRHGVTPQNQFNAAIAPAVERTLGKGEVACSNHAGSTISPHVKHKRYPMFDMLNMCVNEARIVTCIVNHTRTDRETQKN
jgi:hypothetical protein